MYALATIVSSILFASEFQERGSARVVAAFTGAACGVALVWMAWAMTFSVWRAIWRRTRGYPFAIDDVVEVTSGDKRGRTGRVRSYDQAVWHFQVDVEASAGKEEPQWISAGRLRKVLSADKSRGR